MRLVDVAWCFIFAVHSAAASRVTHACAVLSDSPDARNGSCKYLAISHEAMRCMLVRGDRLKYSKITLSPSPHVTMGMPWQSNAV